MTDPTVLIAHADGGLRRQLSEALAAVGFRVIAPLDGTESLDPLRDQSIDAVIMDVAHPLVPGCREALPALPMAECVEQDQDNGKVCNVCAWASDGDGADRPLNLKEAVHAFERLHVEWVLAQADGDKNAAARMLGIGLSSLYRKLGLPGLEESIIGEEAHAD